MAKAKPLHKSKITLTAGLIMACSIFNLNLQTIKDWRSTVVTDKKQLAHEFVLLDVISNSLNYLFLGGGATIAVARYAKKDLYTKKGLPLRNKEDCI